MAAKRPPPESRSFGQFRRCTAIHRDADLFRGKPELFRERSLMRHTLNQRLAAYPLTFIGAFFTRLLIA